MNADPNDEAVYGLNKFTDMSKAEFKKLLTLKAPAQEPPKSVVQSNLAAPLQAVPTALDW